MAELKARFSLIDEMSEKLSSMAECGQNMIGQWENANNSINSAMENAASGASNITSSLNDVSNSLNTVNTAANNALSGTNGFSDSVNTLGGKIDDVAHSAEQLTDANSKTSESLLNENNILSMCEQAAEQLNSEMINAVNAHSNLESSYKQTTNSMREYAESGMMSLDTQRSLVGAWEAAKDSLDNLEEAHKSAEIAQENYDRIILSETEDIKVLESAYNEVAQAASVLSEAENNAQTAVSEFSSALNDITGASESAKASTDNFTESVNNANQTASNFVFADARVAENAQNLGMAVAYGAMQMNCWTENAANADKSAHAFTNTMEQLVQKNLMTAEALYYEGSAAANAKSEMDNLINETDVCRNMQNELANAFEEANSKIAEYSDNENITAKTLEQLGNAGKEAEEALSALTTAQRQADEATAQLNRAMLDYEEGVKAGNYSTKDLEAAQNQAAEAAANLSAAEDNAKKAVEDFSKASDEAGKSLEENGEKSANAIEALASTVIASKIADEVRDIAKSAYELADAFSNAEEVVVNATGASGEALKGLEQSMMSAYSSHNQDLNTTAGAIGEINTRMGLTGEALTDVTGKFLDYSRITGTNVVGSVQNVTKVMNQWGVDMDNVESVLDRLAYAGQISGASVDSLSSTLTTGAASFKEVGLSLDNTIQLLADFELAGINSTTAITAMRTAVNNFTKDGLDAKTALQSTITEIANMENTSEATAKAVEVFGSRAGQQLAAAIKSGTVSIESFTTNLNTADGTLRKTTETGETLGEKWDKSSNKIKSAFTSNVQPVIDKFSSGFATITGYVGEFLNKHPIISGAITAIGVGLGVAALGIAGVAVASLKAIPAVAAFGTALHAALGPIGLVSAGVAVVAGGAMLLANAFSKSETEIEDYNGSLRECADEINNTEAAYEKACEVYGENAEVTQNLSDKLNTLHAQYEKGGGVIADYAQRLEESKQALSDFQSGYNDRLKEIDDTHMKGMDRL